MGFNFKSCFVSTSQSSVDIQISAFQQSIRSTPVSSVAGDRISVHFYNAFVSDLNLFAYSFVSSLLFGVLAVFVWFIIRSGVGFLLEYF